MIELAPAHEFQRRQHQPFLKNIRIAWRDAGRDAPAEIGDMHKAPTEANDLISAKVGLQHVDVGNMRRESDRGIGVVGDDDVTFLERADQIDRRLGVVVDHSVHTDMRRIGDDLAFRIEETGCKVARLFDVKRSSAAVKRVAHFLGDRCNLGRKDFQRNRIKPHCEPPARSSERHVRRR